MATRYSGIVGTGGNTLEVTINTLKNPIHRFHNGLLIPENIRYESDEIYWYRIRIKNLSTTNFYTKISARPFWKVVSLATQPLPNPPPDTFTLSATSFNTILNYVNLSPTGCSAIQPITPSIERSDPDIIVFDSLDYVGGPVFFGNNEAVASIAVKLGQLPPSSTFEIRFAFVWRLAHLSSCLCLDNWVESIPITIPEAIED